MHYTEKLAHCLNFSPSVKVVSEIKSKQTWEQKTCQTSKKFEQGFP